jgi:hypothetical protein
VFGGRPVPAQLHVGDAEAVQCVGLSGRVAGVVGGVAGVAVDGQGVGEVSAVEVGDLLVGAETFDSSTLDGARLCVAVARPIDRVGGLRPSGALLRVVRQRLGFGL